MVAYRLVDGVLNLINSNKIYPAFSLMLLAIVGVVVWRLPEDDLGIAITVIINDVSVSKGEFIAFIVLNNIISMLVEFHTSREEERNVKMIKKKLDHPEVIGLMADFFDITLRLLKRNSKMQIKVISLFASKKQALEKMTGYRDELRDSIGSNVVIV